MLRSTGLFSGLLLLINNGKCPSSSSWICMQSVEGPDRKRMYCYDLRSTCMWFWSCPNTPVGSQQSKLEQKRRATVYQHRYDQHSTPQNMPDIYAGSPQGEPVLSSGWSAAGCVSSAHWEESSPRKASFDSPQTGERERVFSRALYSLASPRVLVWPSVLSFLQTCLFFSWLCVWRLVQEMRKTRQLVRGEGWVSAALERPCWTRCCCCCFWTSIIHRAGKMKRGCEYQVWIMQPAQVMQCRRPQTVWRPSVTYS